MKTSIFALSALAAIAALVSCDPEKPGVDPIAVTGVSIEPAAITLYLGGDTATLEAIIAPEDATDRTVTWSSDDPDEVTVDRATGVVSAVGLGEATITATTKDGGLTAECVVTVKELLEGISFKSDATWTPDSHNARTWSDVVMVERCRGKETFDGGTGLPGNPDCRENPGYGDLFSWAFVEKYGDQLCPAPWSVPSSNDFFALDRDLGGMGDQNAYPNTRYESEWGPTYGGSTSVAGALSGQDNVALYWSSSKSGSDQISVLQIIKAGSVVFPSQAMSPNSGLMLRCYKL
ncbi:MAG: Ig-like domain-containing protein [Alistipes sp.]|jgi:uncharacterized protein (TIGR02145 family)|nr:Ig-like domain-containing protein [Alistipes sp.]